MKFAFEARLQSLDFIRIGVIVLLLFVNTLFLQSIYHLVYMKVVVVMMIFTVLYSLYYRSKTHQVLSNVYIKKYLRWILTLFAFFMLHYYLMPINQHASIFAWLTQLVIVLCVIFMLGSLTFERAMYLFMISATIASVLASVYTLVYFSGESIAYMLRLGDINSTGGLRNINYIAQNVFFFSTFTLYLIYTKKKNRIYVIFFIIQLILVLLSGTKRTFFSLTIFLIVLNYERFRKSFLKNSLLLIFYLGVLLYFLFNNDLLYNILGSRIEIMLADLGLIQANSLNLIDNSTNIRRLLWDEASKMAYDTPLLGYGHAYFQTHSFGFNTAESTFHTHNQYTELYLSFGIFGFLLYYSLFVTTTIRLIRKKNKTEMTYLFLAFFVALFFIIEPSSVTYHVLPTYYLYLFFAYMYSMQKSQSLKIVT